MTSKQSNCSYPLINDSDSYNDEVEQESFRLLSHSDSESDSDFTTTSSTVSSIAPLVLPPLNQTEIPKKFSLVHLVLIIKLYLIMTLILFCSILFLLFMVNGDVVKPTASNDDLSGKNESITQRPATFQINLDSEDLYRLFWNVDKSDETVLLEIRMKQSIGSPLDWFAIGFSDYGQIERADLCLLWFDKRGKLHFEDVKTDNESFVIEDQYSNDCHLIKAKRKHGILRFAFRRPFDTCDPEDYIIDEGTTHIVYATGQGPISRIEGLRLVQHRYGFQRVQLLKPPSASQPSKLSYYVKKFDTLVDNCTVPNVETTYWCRLIRLPSEFERKTHIVQYEAIISNGSESLVHHMELFHCEVDSSLELPAWNGQCSDPQLPEPLKVCKRVIAAWAHGAPPMTYPRHVGLPVGGENYSLYVMLEIHYNNPDFKENVIDSSGIRLYYTDHLRPIDAGILEIGLEYTDKNSIPPKSVFDLHGYCVAECTRAALPSYGITIFASQLHTHLTGVRSWTKHVRGGIELSEINRDNHYSQHFQEIRKLWKPITVFPGDALIQVCRYDTNQRSQITLGGFAITDEMCVNYIHYYPKTNLEVCKSSIDTNHLMDYFEKMKLYEQQNTSSSYPVADNYRNIHWNAKRAQELDILYRTAPLSMQCNRSSGERFPGYWNGVPLTRIVRPMKQPERKCRWSMRKVSDDQDFSSKLNELDPELRDGEFEILDKNYRQFEY